MKQIYKGLLTAIGIMGLWLSANAQVLAQTPVVVKPNGASGLIATPNGLYFRSEGLLWKTDGTLGGTVTVKNAAGQTISGSFGAQAVVNGRLYFEVGTSTTYSLMYADAAGIAQPVTTYSSQISQLFVVGNQLYFTIDYRNLFRTIGDGTQVERLGTYPSDSFTLYNDQLYFLAPKVSSDFAETRNFQTLWRIPLLLSVAVAVTDVPLSSDFGRRFLAVGNSSLYIGGSSSTSPYRVALYQSDGTVGGTTPLSIPATVMNNADYFTTRVLDGQLYFYTNIRNFLSGGPYRVNKVNRSLEDARDVYGPLPAGVNTIASFINYKGLSYFSAGNAEFGRELWRSDGTLVKDIQTGPGTSDPQNFYVHNSLLYFNADGSNIGRELFVTDGTAAGTQLVADLTPGPGNSSPDNLTTYNNELYFTAAGNLYKIPNSVVTPPTTGLTLTAPTYDCTSGQLTFSATGGNGGPIEYRIAGVRDWAASNSFTVPVPFRNGTTLNLDARQNGIVVSIPFNPSVRCASVANPDYGPLVDLFNATDGANWVNKSNWLQGSSPCNWYGITCDGNGRVSELRLSRNNLNGTLPANLGNLSELKTLLIFDEANLSGTLPASLGNLSKLQLLEIEYTKISGSIPESLGNLTQLQSLFLAVNKLTGPLPASLGSLPQLQNLYLFVNQLTGCIPATFAALCGKDVRLYSNAGLSGSEDFGSFCKTGVGGCSPGNFSLTQPRYDCVTGQLLLNTAGGNGTTVEYRIAGLGDWSTSNAFLVPAFMRNGTSFTLQARQNGQVVTAPFTATCQASPVTPSGLYLATPFYDCTTGSLTLTISNISGQPIEYRIAGVRDWAASNSFTVPAIFRNGTTLTLEARQNGQINSRPFTTACQTLTLTTPTYDCATSQLTYLATGGNGQLIEYRIAGVRDWATSNSFTVPAPFRNGVSLTLDARQTGQVVSQSFTTACPTPTRLASAETSTPFEVVVYPNPVGEQFSVGVRGAIGQTVRFRITTLNGQTVVEQRAVAESDAHTETLKLPASAAGLYLLQVSTDTHSKTLKVLKP